jgi:hypothetical protein
MTMCGILAVYHNKLYDDNSVIYRLISVNSRVL